MNEILIHRWFIANWFFRKQKDFNQLLIVLFPFSPIAIGLRFCWATDNKPWTIRGIERPFYNRTKLFHSFVINKLRFSVGII